MDKVEYAPGEEGVIKAFYNTGSHTGFFSKHITVKSNSVKDGILSLTLKGKVFAELSVKNNTLFFYDLVPGKTKTFEVPVENKMNKPLQISDVRITYPHNAQLYFNLSAKVVKGSNGKEYISFALTPKKTVYQFRNSSLTVKLKTNSKQVPSLAFYMRVKIKKVISINPTALFLYTKVDGKTAPAVIEINTELDSGIKVESVSCKGCPLDFKVVDISKKSKQILVKPDYKKGVKGKIFSGIIKVIVNAAGQKTYSIPVRGKLY